LNQGVKQLPAELDEWPESLEGDGAHTWDSKKVLGRLKGPFILAALHDPVRQSRTDSGKGLEVFPRSPVEVNTASGKFDSTRRSISGEGKGHTLGEIQIGTYARQLGRPDTRHPQEVLKLGETSTLFPSLHQDAGRGRANPWKTIEILLPDPVWIQGLPGAKGGRSPGFLGPDLLALGQQTVKLGVAGR
jgi:hypothetical protein